MSTYIGIDMGGTKTLGIVLEQGKVLKSLRKKTSRENVASFVIDLIKTLKGNLKITGIGLAVPGTLNEEKSALLISNNVRELQGIPFKKMLSEKFRVPVKLENDANCFAWGEFLYGAGKDFQNIAGITLGTGLGSGLVLNGKLFMGCSGCASEAGHNIVRAGGIKCTCGNKGCWEQYASSQFIKRTTGLNPKTLYEKAKKGDKYALRIWKYYGYWLGIGLADIANIVDPEAIIVGGGISSAWQFFIEEADKTFRKTTFSPISSNKIKLLKAKLNLTAGAMGAASLFRL